VDSQKELFLRFLRGTLLLIITHKRKMKAVQKDLVILVNLGGSEGEVLDIKSEHKRIQEILSQNKSLGLTAISRGLDLSLAVDLTRDGHRVAAMVISGHADTDGCIDFNMGDELNPTFHRLPLLDVIRTIQPLGLGLLISNVCFGYTSLCKSLNALPCDTIVHKIKVFDVDAINFVSQYFQSLSLVFTKLGVVDFRKAFRSMVLSFFPLFNLQLFTSLRF
jgi:hypothetical protein